MQKTIIFHEYHLLRSSKSKTAAESLAFFTLGIGSPTHSSVHPLSVVLTRTAKVNLFACAGPPSLTHLQETRYKIITHLQLPTNINYQTYYTKHHFIPIEGHGPISPQADIIQRLPGECLVAIFLLLPILITILLCFSCFLLFQNSKCIPGS